MIVGLRLCQIWGSSFSGGDFGKGETIKSIEAAEEFSHDFRSSMNVCYFRDLNVPRVVYCLVRNSIFFFSKK